MRNILCLLLVATLASACHTAPKPANPRTDSRTKAVLNYFYTLEPRADKRLLSGQFVSFGNNASLQLAERIHARTGHRPAILGFDYLGGTSGIATEAADKAAIEYWNQGGLVTISAHLPDPASTNDAARDHGLRDTDVDLNTLLDENSEVHRHWLQELDVVAGGLQELKSAGVVVLWRPFHEMNGDWFWWCGKDPQTFIKLWRQTFDYFSKTKGLDNLLWVYSPNHGDKTAAYYPGDRYVDLIGLDAYTDFIDPDHIKGYAEITQIKKPFGFTEFGPYGAHNPPGDYDYLRFIDGIRKNFPRTVFFMSWNARWSLAANTNTTELLNHPWIVNREDLPPGLAGRRP